MDSNSPTSTTDQRLTTTPLLPLSPLFPSLPPRSQLARWTFKRSLLKCLEAAVLTTSGHRREVLERDGVGVIVRACRWRAAEGSFRPKQEVRVLACMCVRGVLGWAVVNSEWNTYFTDDVRMTLCCTQAHLVRANPAFVRGIAGNAFSCLCIASQNLGE